MATAMDMVMDTLMDIPMDIMAMDMATDMVMAILIMVKDQLIHNYQLLRRDLLMLNLLLHQKLKLMLRLMDMVLVWAMEALDLDMVRLSG